MNRPRLAAIAALFVCFTVVACAAPRWRLQYFYDELESTLVISDLKFPSPRRGLAVGALVEARAIRPVMVSTGDGGKTWSLQKLKDHPVSLFFLDDSLGWMVTARGIWRTDEGGRHWNKVASQNGILRVHFLDPNHGFAVGPRKTILQTTDGGKTWASANAAEKVSTSAMNTVFATLDFLAGRYGIIGGWSRLPRRNISRLPDWMEPEAAMRRRLRPSSTIIVETRDGGANWTPQIVSAFGRVVQILLSPQGSALSLVEFDEAFEWPSEVFQIDLRTGKSTRVFREKDRFVTGMLLDRGGVGYLAAVDCPTALHNSPIPGKVRIYRSADLKKWREMSVDYRAIAHRVTLASADSTHIWAATDTGMILKLEDN